MTPVSADEASESGALFATYHDRIRCYIAGMVRNRAEAEDLTQETFLRAHCHQEKLRDPKAARGWLYRIATNVCLDRLRQRAQPGPFEGEDQDPAALASSPTAHQKLERAETSACVQRCLDYLPDSYRAVILLREAHGLTAEEIATLLNVSVGAVKIRLHRARRRLLEIMDIGCAISEERNGVPCCTPKV